MRDDLCWKQNNKYLDDSSHQEVSILQLLSGLKLPLVLDVCPVDQGPRPGTDPPVDVLRGHAAVAAAGVNVSEPGTVGVTAS